MPGIGSVPLSLWWLALPVVVAAGVLAAGRAGKLAQAALPAACGASVAMTYALMIGYAAPRFLIPTYGLFSLPVAGLPFAIASATKPRLRPIAVGGLGCVLGLQLTSQLMPG